MATIVMKFGGDALGVKERKNPDGAPPNLLKGAQFHAEKFQHMARIVRRRRDAGDRVAIVVSAFGDSTDRLLAMAKQLCADAPARELDMLMSTGEQQAIALMAIALHAEGLPSRSFTGPQVGIVTESVFGKARIKSMQVDRVIAAMNEGAIPVIAGFQGATVDNELTTLGRGGSDITAVAVAAAIKSDLCEFYKDVDGIFTTDPRIHKGARKIDRISYDEMLELASSGAGVLHSRAVEFAKNYDVPLHARSYVHDQPGTFVLKEDKAMEDIVVSGVAFNREEAKITIAGIPDRPGMAADIFMRLAEKRIVVDMIIQNAARDGRNDISFTVGRADFPAAMKIAQAEAEYLGASGVQGDATMAKVSAVGVGMRSHPDVPSRMFRALAQAGINIQMISTSEIKISCIIKEDELERAVKAVHEAFE